MPLPQPIQYQGSKRKLADKIISYFPSKIERLVEPFAGSAAISIAAAAKGITKNFWINDLNPMLIKLLQSIVLEPKEISEYYKQLWTEQFVYEYGSIEHYYHIREKFNSNQDHRLLLYLLARCVKGAVRYNSDGKFNQSPDKRRHGTQPKTMEKNIFAFSQLLPRSTVFTCLDYQDVLDQTRNTDLIYMDPPYQGVCGDRDSRYYSQIKLDTFISALHKLNERRIPFLLSYDGKRGDKQFGSSLPAELGLYQVELEAGRSTQSTLLGRNELTVESLYISPALAEQLKCHITPQESLQPGHTPLIAIPNYV